MGYGQLSSVYTFSSRDVPSKPSAAPSNDPSVTSSSTIGFTYLPIIKDGGAPIMNYNIYIDDGNDGPFGAAINNGLNLNFDTAANGLTLSTGLTYRIKYSGVNV